MCVAPVDRVIVLMAAAAAADAAGCDAELSSVPRCRRRSESE